ncbi:MAG: uroporphyrinogen-III C-methyltransferase, partial [Sulfolobales archaeon]
MAGKVYIIGAGPGDPELLTIKAYKILNNADIIIYDRLVNKEIIKMFDNGKKELVYVGKELGESFLQDKINELLYIKAKENKIVARLKGGDPYVLGRGEEECMYLIERGIECEVVPGVSSAIAVPAYAGIPVTSRYYSSGFTVITGTTIDDNVISHDYIPEKGTIIILMGLHKITEVKEVLLKKRKPDEDIAVIENGTLPNQRVILGKLYELDKIIKENRVNPPSIIVIGSVVKLREKL